MEKMSRMKKYKDLREQINEEVAIDRDKPIVEEKIEEDDFLKEIKPRDYHDVVVDANSDGTLNGITFEQLLSKDADVDKALSRAKAYGGREFDTRMDIYNRIRKQSSEASKKMEKEQMTEMVQTKEEKEPENQPSIVEMPVDSTPEVKEEVKEEMIEVEEIKEEVKEEPIEVQEEVKIEDDNNSDEEETMNEEAVEKKKTSLGVKILNGIIFILVVVVLCLFGYLINMFM